MTIVIYLLLGSMLINKIKMGVLEDVAVVVPDSTQREATVTVREAES